MSKHSTMQKVSEVAIITVIGLVAAAYLDRRTTKRIETQHDVWADKAHAWNLAVQARIDAANNT